MEKKQLSCITLPKLVFLYVFGSVAGVILEGIFFFCLQGRWETHVVSMIAPLCIIYGFGAVMCYVGYVVLKDKNLVIRFIAFALAGFFLELVCGLFLEYGLSMRAWDYSGQRFNFHGHVSLKMTLGWGLIGVAATGLFSMVDPLLDRLTTKSMTAVSKVVSVILALDLCLTMAAIGRWSERHFDLPPSNAVEESFDRLFNDSFMEKRFCEWRFIEK